MLNIKRMSVCVRTKFLASLPMQALPPTGTGSRRQCQTRDSGASLLACRGRLAGWPFDHGPGVPLRRASKSSQLCVELAGLS